MQDECHVLLLCKKKSRVRFYSPYLKITDPRINASSCISMCLCSECEVDLGAPSEGLRVKRGACVVFHDQGSAPGLESHRRPFSTGASVYPLVGGRRPHFIGGHQPHLVRANPVDY
jgi:hypothetical protein